jgi:hypothetical protein
MYKIWCAGGLLLNYKAFISAVMFFLLSFALPASAADGVKRYDVAVIGAGTGGTAAAIQAARMGMTVALIERSDWVGGQMTGAAVSTLDDKWLTRMGIYREFIDSVRSHYESMGRNVNQCYWHEDTIGFEPAVGQKILLEMLAREPEIKLYLRTEPISATLKDGKVVSAAFRTERGKMTIKASIFIDATEHGDFIPLTKAAYRSGNGVVPKTGAQGIIQDITYPAVVKYYPDGAPDELVMKTPPPHYNEYVMSFRKVITADGDFWPGDYPFNVPTHNSYRALPDPDNDSIISGGNWITWHLITKTVVNWANDYPGEDGDGLSAAYLEDPEYRKAAERAAMAKTLAFIYYMQTELGMTDWAVDNGQGYGSWFSNDWKNWDEMPDEFAPILSNFPPFPYVRESRRIVGVETMTVEDIIRDQTLRRTLKNNKRSVALGEYPVDIHGTNKNEYLELDLGETSDKIPNDWEGDGGLFQIPLGVFIPEKVDGLLAAEKNISVSRVANGSTRLQPVTMHTGQAAGAIASLAVKSKKNPRQLRAIDVQKALLDSKMRISLYVFKDAPDYSMYWPAAEIATVYEFMDPISETEFGTDDPMTWRDVEEAFRRAFKIRRFPKGAGELRPDTFADWLEELYSGEREKIKIALENIGGSGPLTKGRLARAIYEIMQAK